MLPGPLQAGDVLAGRYRLLDPVVVDSTCSLWRAHDQVLDRDVAVRALPATNLATRVRGQAFLAAAAAAGQVAHPGLVRVYDAALDVRGRRGDVAYVIREWVEAEPLDEHLLRVGELSPPDAADVLRQVADALTAAHAGGISHGRLHPGNVLVTPHGRVRVTDTAVAAALRETDRTLLADAPAVSADTRDAAALLYALVTTRWPTGLTPQPGGRLATSPVDHGHALAPHQVRASVPRQLDHVIARALEPARVPTLPPLRTPEALAEATDRVAALHHVERPAAGTPRPPGFVRRHALLLFALAAIATTATTGWYLGLSIGKLDRPPEAVNGIVGSPAPASPGGTAPPPAIDLTAVQVHDFDPYGDGQENPDQVHNAVDGETPTAWLTSRYRTAAFGGIKPGVGLLLDLGKVVELHQVQVGFTAPGAHVELLMGLVAPRTPADLTLVASDTSGAQVATLAAAQPAPARYVLVWITSLPKDGGGYRVGISEIAAR